uniref:non-specific serine/threonine protein kinase n=1 Tax=Panstrongylus megistus TaxID=65343 RepID=A0A069DUK7_9HEMI
MRNEDSEFSSLRTVSSFDRGDNCTVAVGVNNQEIQNFSPSSLLVESLIEQLCKLMEKDPHSQKQLYITVCEKLHSMNLIGESYERDEFQFMRSHYQKALYRLLAIAKTTTVEKNALFPRWSGQLYLSCSGVLEWSRYCTEFEELEFIAKGGFGQVYKAKHRLDGEIYAVKKILLRYRSVNDFLQNLKEVKMLAKLNNTNIVSYKAAWLEPLDELQSLKENKRHEVPAILNGDNEEENDGSFDVVFEGSEKSVSIIDDSESMSHPTSDDGSFKLVDGIVCKKKFYQFSYSEKEFSLPKQSATLYIQMHLCERTLRHWLDQRNQIKNLEININQCIEIFKKIVKGVEYIHSQGIVHHDIKPSNIFVSSDLTEVQVGDFGLACCLLAHPPTSLSVIATHPQGQVGTRLYAAPEQLQGTCDPKSDVYSLGIVLLELIQPFNTDMERSKVIGELRSGRIQTELNMGYPELAKIMSATVKSIKQRPTSTELLKSIEDLQNIDTVKLVAEQSELIRQLRRESEAKDEEIAYLKKQLQELKQKENGLPLP